MYALHIVVGIFARTIPSIYRGEPDSVVYDKEIIAIQPNQDAAQAIADVWTNEPQRHPSVSYEVIVLQVGAQWRSESKETTSLN